MTDEGKTAERGHVGSDPWLPPEDLEPASPDALVDLRVRGMTRGETEFLEKTIDELREESYKALLLGDCDFCQCCGEAALRIQAMLAGKVPYRKPDKEDLLDWTHTLAQSRGSSEQKRDSCSLTCELQTPEVPAALANWRLAIAELDNDPDVELATQVRASAADMEPDDPVRVHLLRTHGLTRKEKSALRKGKADLLTMGLAASKVNDHEFFYIAINLCQTLEAIIEGRLALAGDRIPRGKFEWAEVVRRKFEGPDFAAEFEAWKAVHSDAPAWENEPGHYWPDSA